MAGFVRYVTYPECSHAVAGKATGTRSLTGTRSRFLSPTLRYNVKNGRRPSRWFQGYRTSVHQDGFWMRTSNAAPSRVLGFKSQAPVAEAVITQVIKAWDG